MIRVLIAEDSATSRELLTAILQSDPEIEIVGLACNGNEAVALTERLRPDVVTMDINMPEKDGFEATKEIMRETPTPIVVISGQHDVHQVSGSMNALRIGALAVLAKPTGLGMPGFEDECRNIVQTVKLMSDVKVIRHKDLLRPRGSKAGPNFHVEFKPRVVAIAASTGGPQALHQILSNLKGSFPAPILLVQHIAHSFVEGFAGWLNANCPLEVKIARDGETLKAGYVYLSPDDCHIGILDASRIAISHAPPVGGFRPAGTFLFESAAKVFGNAVLAVQLTGMGRDGVEGLRAVHDAGGCVIAQDEESSVVFGMPGEAIAAGVVDRVLPLNAIAEHICKLVAINNGESAS